MRILAFALLFAAMACAEPSAGLRDISQEEFLASPPAGATVLDVRTAQEFASGHVPNALNIPHDELASRLSELAGREGAPVVVYCERGGRAGQAASVLLEAGFREVLHLDGDMSAWRAAGRPIAVPPGF